MVLRTHTLAMTTQEWILIGLGCLLIVALIVALILGGLGWPKAPPENDKPEDPFKYGC